MHDYERRGISSEIVGQGFESPRLHSRADFDKSRLFIRNKSEAGKSMQLAELVELVVDHTDGYECFPFNKPTRHEKIIWHVVKHQSNDKIIAMVFEKDDELLIDLKLTIEHGQQMRLIRGVEPGFHMNKEHWNTVYVNATDLTVNELINMVKESAELTI